MRFIAIISALTAFAAAGQAANTVDFNTDIRPILADRCFHCHGPDDAARKANLRLDLEEFAKEKAIAPGDPFGSPIIDRITSDDADERMPPPEAEKPSLTADEVNLFEQWIAEGAEWNAHWAYVPPTRPNVPEVANTDWCKIPIDNFILARLDAAGMAPSDRASRETLIRRLSFDLTGLPPTIAEIDAFLADTSPNAYERVVDRLLASPRYGEHMAAFWLDGARYADTNGFQNDFRREMWPWRDWVIQAFNDNMPYDQFVTEQIAGDLLPNATDSQRIATGFNRNNRATTEGGSIEEEWWVENRVDRVETTSSVFLGLTMGCGRCHSHKYDPISQKEFYEFFAFFSSTADKGFYNETRGNVGPSVSLPTAENIRRLEEFDTQIEAAKADLDATRESHADRFDEWRAILAYADGATSVAAALRLPLNGNLRVSAQGRAVSKVVSPAAYAKADGPVWSPAELLGPGLSLDGTMESHVEAGDALAIDHNTPFTFSAWVHPETGGAIFSKMDDANAYRGIDALLGNEGELAVHIVHKWKENAIKVVTGKRIKMNEWSHVAATYDGSGKAAGVRVFVNGVPVPIETVEVDTLNGTIATDQPIRIGRRSTGGSLKGIVSDVQFHTMALDESAVNTVMNASLASRTRGELSEARVEALRAFYKSRAELAIANKREALKAVQNARAAYERDAVQTVMVLEELEEPRPAYRLIRGAYDAPDKSEELWPDVPAFLPPMPKDTPQNRLGLAKWLTDPGNPLTARVAVNRLWQQTFGRGLVRTPEDFGMQGQPPTHPQLLDWLSTEFIAMGWDMKRFQKMLVMSATYQQSSARSDEALKRDPENKLYAHAPRMRLRAEIVRDNALAISGLLVDKIGGPSVKPYQPEGLWKELMGGAGQGPYVQGTGEDLYRRSLYTYRKRTVPHPTLTTFDAPSWEICRVRRATTNTPLQSLALLNDTTYVEAARKFGERIIREGGSDAASRITFAFRVATSRTPNDRERKVLASGLENYVAHYKSNTQAAEAFVKHGESAIPQDIDTADLAAYTALAGVILNMDETITRE